MAFDIHHHISNSTYISDLLIFTLAVFKNYNKPFTDTDSAINVDIYDNTYLINEYIDLGGIFRTRKKEWMRVACLVPPSSMSPEGDRTQEAASLEEARRKRLFL